MSAKARRWVAVQFGGPGALRSIEVDVPEPKHGHVTIDVRGVGMNPADAKHIAPGQDPKLLPLVGTTAAELLYVSGA